MTFLRKKKSHQVPGSNEKFNKSCMKSSNFNNLKQSFYQSSCTIHKFLYILINWLIYQQRLYKINLMPEIKINLLKKW